MGKSVLSNPQKAPIDALEQLERLRILQHRYALTDVQAAKLQEPIDVEAPMQNAMQPVTFQSRVEDFHRFITSVFSVATTHFDLFADKVLEHKDSNAAAGSALQGQFHSPVQVTKQVFRDIGQHALDVQPRMMGLRGCRTFVGHWRSDCPAPCQVSSWGAALASCMVATGCVCVYRDPT